MTDPTPPPGTENETPLNEPISLWRLILRFLYIGATGFGGPMALIGLMHSHLVDKRVVSEETFTEGVAVGQILPGPVAVDCATHIGYKLRGLWGAIATTVALILPAFLLMLVLTPLYFIYGHVPAVDGFFKGAGPAIIAVIFAAGFKMAQKSTTDYRSAAIALLVMAGLLQHLNPILLILVGGALGMLLRPRRKEGEKC